MKNTKKLGMLIMVAMTGVVLSGCSLGQKAGEKIIEETIERETGSKVDVDAGGDRVEIKTAEGEMSYSAGGDVKLPENFPEELIVAEDARVVMSTTADEATSVSFTSSIDVNGLGKSYLEGLPKSGWTKVSEINVDSGLMMNFTRGKQSLVITIGSDDNGQYEGRNFVSLIMTSNKN